MRHFIDLKDFDSDRLQAMLETAAQMKSGTDKSQPLAGKYVGMIFEKPSTRTRVSFEVGISQLGGTPVVLAASGSWVRVIFPPFARAQASKAAGGR